MADETEVERLQRLAPVPLTSDRGIFWLDGCRQGYTDGYQAAKADLRPLLEEAQRWLRLYHVNGTADDIEKVLVR